MDVCLVQGHRSRSGSRKPVPGTDVGLHLSHQSAIRAKYSSPGSTSDDTDAAGGGAGRDDDDDDAQDGYLVGHSGEGEHTPRATTQ